MGEKFNFNNRHKLNSNERKKILPAHKLLLKFGLKKGDYIADLGAGTGFFTFAAAKIVGRLGLVYALDISEDMLEEIKKQIITLKSNTFRSNKYAKINIVKVFENNLVIDNNSVNFILASLVLHEVDNLNKTLEEIERILRNNGKIAIIESKEKIEAEKIIQILKKYNFKNISYSDINDLFYSIEALKIKE